MKIISTRRAAQMLKDRKEAERALHDSEDDLFELEAPDSETSAVAVNRLAEMSTVLSTLGGTRATYQVELTIAGTPEGMRAAQEIMANLGRSAIEMPPTQEETSASEQLSAWIAPTAGGMALGFTGGLGLGMVISAVRSSAATSGNPVINGIAVGLGLVGTAVGGYIGATGARISRVKFPGGEMTFSQRVES